MKENYLLFILPLVQLSTNAATRDNPTSTELDMYWHVYIYHYLSCVLNNTDPQESAKLTNFPPTESKFPQLGGNPWGWVRRTPSCAAYDSPHLEGLIYILPKSIQNKPPPSQLRPKEADRIHVRTRPWSGILASQDLNLGAGGTSSTMLVIGIFIFQNEKPTLKGKKHLQRAIKNNCTTTSK